MIKINLGNKIKRLRQNNKMSQLELATALGVSRSAIAGYENGYTTPSLDVINKMSKIFEVSVDELMDTNKDGKFVYKFDMDKIAKIQNSSDYKQKYFKNYELIYKEYLKKILNEHELDKILKSILNDLALGKNFTWEGEVLTEKDKENLYEFINNMITIIPLIIGKS